MNGIRIWVMAVVVLLALLAGTTSGHAGEAVTDDSLALPEHAQSNARSLAELPVVTEDQVFRTVFTLRNPYDRAVRVDLIDRDCACLELELSERFLLPHEEATMTFAVENSNTSGIRKHRVWLHLTDPDLEPIAIHMRWRVRPHVTVDILPEGGPYDRRPDDRQRRDVYLFVEEVRPDEAQRLQKVILVQSPEGSAPEGGLVIERIEHDSAIWQFELQPIDERSVRVVATAKDPEATLPDGEHEDVAVLHSNHPRKAEIPLHFRVVASEEAGRSTELDPFGGMR